MSYLGFAKILCRDFLKKFSSPRVLEIGIDHGQTSLPIIHNLSSLFDEFTYVGIDVKIRGEFLERLGQFVDISINILGDERGKKNVELYEINSLDWLFVNKSLEKQFDLIMIDGDHNFYTVYHELSMLKSLRHNHTLMICDDYSGRFSNKDLFYSEKEEYRDNEHLRKPVRLDLQGVKSAINYYVTNIDNCLQVSTCGSLDPCLIYNKNYIKVETKSLGKEMRSSIIDFKFLSEEE